MKILLTPLQRIGNLVVDTNVKLTEIQVTLTTNLRLAVLQGLEIRKQTKLLTDIKGLLSSQNKFSPKKDKKKSRGGFKMPSMKDGAGTAVAIVAMAAGVLAAVGLFSLMPTLGAGQILSALAVAGLFLILTPIFIKITETLAKGPKSMMGKVSGGGIKDTLKTVGGTGLAMLGMAATLALSSVIMQLIIPISPASFFTALLIGIAFIPLSIAFGKIIMALSKAGVKMDKSGIAKIAMAGIAMVAIGFGIAMVAKVFAAALPTTFEAPPLEWTLRAGLAILIFAGTFAMIARVVDKVGADGILLTGVAMAMIGAGILGVASIFQNLASVKAFEAPPLDWSLKTGLALLIFAGTFAALALVADKVGVDGIFLATLAMGAVGMGIVGIAYIFQHLKEVTDYVVPPIKWIIKAGLSVLIFSVGFAALALVADKVGIKGMLLGAAAVPLVAIGILAAAWIFQYLPDKFIAPELDWAMNAGLSIAIFAIPMVLIGLAAVPSGGLALLLGAAGMILAAGTIWVVAHIFSNLPKGFASGAKEVSTALFAPIDALTMSLSLMKSKIGIENMIPLGKGLIAIAAGWLALSAAMAGKAIGGVIEGIASGAGKVMDILTGGLTKTDGPFVLLDMLIKRSSGLVKIGESVGNIGAGMLNISIAGFKATSVLKEINKSARLSDKMKLTSLSMSRIGRSYTEIAKASKMISIPAMEASTKMFNAIAHVAKMKGEDAMSVLAKELMRSVIELSKIVDKLDANVTKQPEGLKGAMDSSMQKFIDKIKGKTADIKGEVGESGLIDIAPIVEAIQELEERFMRPIKVQEV